MRKKEALSSTCLDALHEFRRQIQTLRDGSMHEVAIAAVADLLHNMPGDPSRPISWRELFKDERLIRNIEAPDSKIGRKNLPNMLPFYAFTRNVLVAADLLATLNNLTGTSGEPPVPEIQKIHLLRLLDHQNEFKGNTDPYDQLVSFVAQHKTLLEQGYADLGGNLRADLETKRRSGTGRA
jgi:hypothetical protein